LQDAKNVSLHVTMALAIFSAFVASVDMSRVKSNLLLSPR